MSEATATAEPACPNADAGEMEVCRKEKEEGVILPVAQGPFSHRHTAHAECRLSQLRFFVTGGDLGGATGSWLSQQCHREDAEPH